MYIEVKTMKKFFRILTRKLINKETNSRYSIVFQNGFYYNYHFIMKQLAEEFGKQFTCLGENTEKYKTFHFQYKNKLQELIKMEKIYKKISYRSQFIDSAIFMASSFSKFC